MFLMENLWICWVIVGVLNKDSPIKAKSTIKKAAQNI